MVAGTGTTAMNENVRSLIKWEDAGSCTGCRSCELACSYHHSGCFAPTLSSLHVPLDRETGEIEIELDETCDNCNGAAPFCAGFCSTSALAPLFPDLDGIRV